MIGEDMIRYRPIQMFGNETNIEKKRKKKNHAQQTLKKVNLNCLEKIT